jgi:PDZ domain-containing protein
MTQRTWAGLLAVPLLLALWFVALITPLPFVTYQPGLTVDVLGAPDGKETIQVSGHKTYRDDGQLRLTTVYVTRPESDVNLLQLMAGWISTDDAVYPKRAVYPKGETDAASQQEGALQMVSSQDAAVATALTELGIHYGEATKVVTVDSKAPAGGVLKPGDLILAVNGKSVTTPSEVEKAVTASGTGKPLELRIERSGSERTLTLTPEESDGKARIGIQLLPSYRFPFDVSVGIDDQIGGPSAGLMFSLGIYDTLTPGSLTDGRVVAGTGTIAPTGKVGPIGGIQQKIPAARDTGAELFLVPSANCREALGADNGDMRLVRTSTMHDAVDALETWVDDPNAELPSCEGVAS